MPRNGGNARPGQAAVALRVQGVSYADIADTLGLSTPAAALAAVQNELADHLPADEQSREHLRREQHVRLESLWAAVAPTAMDQHSADQLPAAKTGIAILDRIARLHGLDAPAEIAVYTPAQREIDEWVSAQIANTMPALEEPDIVDVESEEVPVDG